jgi:hypothetical protein
MDAIYDVADSLGWPWKRSKTCPFAPTFSYLGFEWSLPEMFVRIHDAKKAKYAARINTWLGAVKASLKDTKVFAGTLVHCELAVPNGHPRIAAILKFSASFPRAREHRFIRRHIPDNARSEAEWWLQCLSYASCGCSITTRPPVHPIHIASDTSSSFGIGVCIDNHWLSWRLLYGWKECGRDIGWAEALGVELTVIWLITLGLHDAQVTCHCDNQGVVLAWHGGRSRNFQQNHIIMSIMARAMQANLHVNIVYMKSADNPANAPSRDKCPHGMTHSDLVLLIPDDARPFIAYTSL